MPPLYNLASPLLIPVPPSSSNLLSPFCPFCIFSLCPFVWASGFAYSMLKHLPRSGMDFLHIFNLSWTLHSFPSIWKTSSIIPIHKMGKPLDSPVSFRPISLTSCVSKLFERIILSCLLFFLESNSILSPHQAGFRPGWSTLDQILYLSQSISDGFNKPRPGSWTILLTIDFSKAFDSVWHPALFHKLISAGLPPCFARWTQSFLSNRCACVVYQNQKSRFSASSWGPSKESISLLYKAFLRPLITYASPGWFPSPISPNWNASTEPPVAPSPAASRSPLSHFFSPRLL